MKIFPTLSQLSSYKFAKRSPGPSTFFKGKIYLFSYTFCHTKHGVLNVLDDENEIY